MPRGCGCAGNSCSCLIVSGNGVLVEGTGNASAPYIISLNNESGYIAYPPITLAGTVLNLSGTVAGDLVVFIEAEANFSVTLPSDAPLGTHLDIVTVQSFGAVMTFNNAPFWPGGTVPAFTAVRNMVRLIAGGPAVGQWWGVAHLNMA